MLLSLKCTNFAVLIEAMKDYTIDIAQLDFGHHQFIKQAGSKFFENFDSVSPVSGSFTATVDLDKSETLLKWDIVIEGNLELVCDRSLDSFDLPFETEDTLIMKLGDHDEDLGDGVKLIHRNTQQIDLEQDLYELVLLSVPMKKLHPRYKDENIDGEGLLVYSTETKDKVKKVEVKPEEDPRWAALKNLKF